MKIFIGADHAGFKLKEKLIPFLEEGGYEVEDVGAYAQEPEDDYTDFVVEVAREISKDPEGVKGIVIGYSGQGEAGAANRFKRVRAAVYYGDAKPIEETHKKGKPVGIIEASRKDNDSNILSIGAGFVSLKEAQEAIKLWLATPFEAEERHIRRITKMDILSK